MPPSFQPDKFAAAVKKIGAHHGMGERFNREAAKLVFHYFGPPGMKIEDVAIRVGAGSIKSVRVEMFVLGGGLFTIAVVNGEVDIKVDKDISEIAQAPAWVNGGDYAGRVH